MLFRSNLQTISDSCIDQCSFGFMGKPPWKFIGLLKRKDLYSGSLSRNKGLARQSLWPTERAFAGLTPCRDSNAVSYSPLFDKPILSDHKKLVKECFWICCTTDPKETDMEILFHSENSETGHGRFRVHSLTLSYLVPSWLRIHAARFSCTGAVPPKMVTACTFRF